ncbi:MAG TPA: hypothetical protein VLD65_05505 [Anaerolineales bacterium]|nr:hypothetical protein [Anaerolineales bacterium]
MLQKITQGALVLCMYLICLGCNGKSIQGIQVTPTSNPAVPVVNVASPIKSESSLSNQTIELRNCDGEDELHQSLAVEAQIVCNIMISDEAMSTITRNTKLLSKEMKLPLEDQIEIAYQQVFDEAKTGVDQNDLMVPINRIRTFQINWTKQVFSSTISFTMDDEAYTVSYTYTLDIPDAIIAMETGCTA